MNEDVVVTRDMPLYTVPALLLNYIGIIYEQNTNVKYADIPLILAYFLNLFVKRLYLSTGLRQGAFLLRFTPADTAACAAGNTFS